MTHSVNSAKDVLSANPSDQELIEFYKEEDTEPHIDTIKTAKRLTHTKRATQFRNTRECLPSLNPWLDSNKGL